MKPWIAFVLTAVVSLFLMAGCTPAQQGASEHTFYSTGQPNIRVDVAEPFSLVAQGKRWTSTISDTSIEQPFTGFGYAAYLPDTSGPVSRSAHVIVGDLPPMAWRFIPENWKSPETLTLGSDNMINGKRWTIQMKTVVAQGDWFSDLWAVNNRQTPLIWLAKRWSSNPEIETRIVAEYREAASECVTNSLVGKDRTGKLVFLHPDATALWARCRADIDAFAERAESIFTLGALNKEDVPTKAAIRRYIEPTSAPDVRKLVGDVEPAGRAKRL